MNSTDLISLKGHNMFEKRRMRLLVLIGFTLVWIAVLLALPPIPQDPAYHEFVDRARILGLPNFWNVMSNLPFLFVGIAGLVTVGLGRPPGGLAELRVAYVIFFVVITLIAFGSGYYHLQPHLTVGQPGMNDRGTRVEVEKI